jgi:hypothetical protein
MGRWVFILLPVIILEEFLKLLGKCNLAYKVSVSIPTTPGRPPKADTPHFRVIVLFQTLLPD